MKRWIVCSIITVVIVIILIFSYRYFSKTNSLEREFDIIIPRDANIIEFQRSFRITGESLMAAKIVISSGDYESFISSLSDNFMTFNPTDYEDDNLDDIVPPGSDTHFNIEKFDEDISWWDLDTNQISYLFYREDGNEGIGVRTPYIRRIYTVKTNDTVELYLISRQ